MNNLAPPFMDMFSPRVNKFNVRNFQKFVRERKITVKRGLETVSYSCPLL